MANWKKELNKEQLTAVTHDGSPLLILAGAGSGKTKVLVYRAIYLVSQRKIRPEEIVLLTFTNKAAEEMKLRVAKISKGPSGILGTSSHGELGFAGTFHTFCARILRIYGGQIGLASNFVIYDSDDSEAALKLAVKKLVLDPKSNKPGMFQHLISRLKNDLITIEDLTASANNEFYKKLLSVWRVYDDILTQANAVDFDDLLVKSVKLLSAPLMRKKIAGRYSQILVDEYQDTNKAQFVLTKLLVTNPNGLMVVGDASQAIYSFRGADFRNLTLLSTEFPNLTTLRLPRNYRSTQTILSAAYGVIVNNINHPVLKLEAEKEAGERIEMIEAIDEREEAAYVTKTAQRLVGRGETLGVLYRTNAQSRAIEEALIRERIDYKLVGGIRFYNRAEIKDLLAYLRVIYNKFDTISWERVEHLGKRNRAKFEEWLGHNHGSLAEKSPREVLEEVIEETGYLGRFDDRDEADVARVENVKELLAVSSEFEKINEFLESVALIQSEELPPKADRSGLGGASVTMMTIHAAKGLEFDEVVIVGLEEGLLPHSRSLMQIEDIEEERRLMYVAMTRARTKLHLTLTRSRLMYGGRQTSLPSRFLSEIPHELLRLAQKRYEEREIGRNIQRNKDIDYDARRIIVEEETKADFDEIDSW